MRLRATLTVAGVTAGTLLTSPPGAAAPLRVTGTAAVEAAAILREGTLEVNGRLVDDRGAPLRGSEVRVRIEEDGTGRRPPPSPTPCRGAPPPRVTGAEIAQLTDEAGAFCLLIAPALTATRVRVRYPGAGDHEASPAALVPVVTGPRALALDFAPTPRRLELDAGDPRIWIRAEAIPPATSPARIALEVLLVAPDGAERPVVDAWAAIGERTALPLPVAALGAPGRATLRLRFAGDVGLPATTRQVVVEKTARVELALAEPPRGDVSRGSALVLVRAGSRLGPVATGSVELRLGERTVGAAPVVEGLASPLASFGAAPGGPVHLTARFLPDSPWWLPGEPLAVTVTVPPLPVWQRWPWMLAGAGVALWVLRGWRRPGARVTHEPALAPALPPGKPAVEVLALGPERSGWQGRVRDAHLGGAIPDAEVALLAPSAAGPRVVARTVTDDQGRFRLAAAEVPGDGARLRVEARWHSALEQPAPASGELLVSLVTRRRAILDHLVGWAERVGRPWFWGAAEPTPGHVARVARERGDAPVAAWAEAAEAAAFGAEPVDAPRERAVAEREPPEHGSR